MTSRMDPDVPYRYQIEMGFIKCVRFAEAQGLKATTSVKSIREGGNNVYETALIEGQTFDELVIKKGFYSAGSEFFQWMKELHIKTKTITRESISLVILNDKYEETGRYNLHGCFPTEYEGPAFNAGSKDIAFETIKIHYDYFEYRPGDAVAGLIHAAAASASNSLG